jgi:hypothetical protein
MTMEEAMPSTLPTSETISRKELIGRLRVELALLTDEETSICKAAAERGIFCNGFARYGDHELKRRYGWIVRKRPGMTREELEAIANDWQLAQQEVHETPLACDVQAKAQDTCGGWTDFSDTELARFYNEITGREVIVAGDR